MRRKDFFRKKARPPSSTAGLPETVQSDLTRAVEKAIMAIMMGNREKKTTNGTHYREHRKP